MHERADQHRERDGGAPNNGAAPSAAAHRTSTAPRSGAWAIADEVVRLRVVGTMTSYKLRRQGAKPSTREPSPRRSAIGDTVGYSIGSAQRNDICLIDPDQQISRNHAILVASTDGWSLLDLGSKNGLRVDGVRQYAAQLEPGMEIALGGVTLIAESTRYMELRGFLCRLLGWGWGDEVDKSVDRAMRDLRWAQRRGSPIALRGQGDLVPLARELHRRLCGAGSPFIVCDPHRGSGDDDGRPSANYEPWEVAVSAATGGMLCLRNERLPTSFPDLLAQVRCDEQLVLLLICDDGSDPLRVPSIAAITLPPLPTRGDAQLAHVVFEYLLDARREFAVPGLPTEEDRAWVITHAATSLAEISKATRRLTALRFAGSFTRAADMLGMAPVSLRRWLERRALPASFVEDNAHVAHDCQLRPDR